MRPTLVDAGVAHQEAVIEYAEDGTAICRLERVKAGASGEIRIPPSRQYPAIRTTFDDLNKALSHLSNSPLVNGETTLRKLYEDEAARYDELASSAYADGRFEPDYGTYVIDHHSGSLYLLAPARWHRLSLVTSNAMLLTDAQGELSWEQVRERLEGTMVGFAGLSVGSNILEGWLREARPKQVKVADPDWLELPNYNRCERASLRHLVADRAERFDIRNPYETPRRSKAECVAYEQHLVDPYLDIFVYNEGITRSNIDRFLLGDGDEPKIQVLVEEIDDLEMKLLLREKCREYGIDVIMLSDFGHRTHVLWNFFASDGTSPISHDGDDEALYAALAGVRAGDRSQLLEFIRCLCGEESVGDQFLAWLEGRGEQPTSSLPQAGATAMATGAIGGKELALHALGHNFERPSRRVIYDFLRRSAGHD